MNPSHGVRGRSGVDGALEVDVDALLDAAQVQALAKGELKYGSV